jgi:hypothetical protein
MSKEDIDKGSKWDTDIAKELQLSNFGLICVAKDRITAPWLNFEAGALSKSMSDKTYVATLLVNVKPSDLSNTPLAAFQSTQMNHDDIKLLMNTMNNAAGEKTIDSNLFESSFEYRYASLDEKLNALSKETDETSEEKKTTEPVNADILEEILKNSRNTQRQLNDLDFASRNEVKQMIVKIDELYDRIDKQENFSREPAWSGKSFTIKKPSNFRFPEIEDLKHVLRKFRDSRLASLGNEFIKQVELNLSNGNIGFAAHRFMAAIDEVLSNEWSTNIKSDLDQMRDLCRDILNKLHFLNSPLKSNETPDPTP